MVLFPCVDRCLSLLRSFPDWEPEEHLVVSFPAGVEDPLLRVMGQDEPAAAPVAPLDIKIQTQKEEEPEESTPLTSASSASAPDTFPTEEKPEICDKQSTTQTVLPPREQTPPPPPAPTSTLAPAPAKAPALAPDPAPVLDAPAPVLDAPAPVLHAPALAPDTYTELASTQASGPPGSTHPGPPEEILPAADPETQLNAPLSHTEHAPTTPPPRSKLPPLKINAARDEIPPGEDEEAEIRPPQANYKFDPDQLDDSFNPFMSGGSKIQNTPPPCDPAFRPRLEPIGSASEPVVKAAETPEMPAEAKPLKMEFGLDEGEVTKPPPKKLGGRKTATKVPGKKLRPKVAGGSGKPPPPEPTVSDAAPQPLVEPVPERAAAAAAAATASTAASSDPSAPGSLDDVPIPKSKNTFDPSQWDDPDFNPFGSNSAVSSSPTPPKASYQFDPDNFDDSVDPFKPSKGLSNEEPTAGAPPPENKVTEVAKEKATPPPAEKKARQLPKKNKDRSIT